MSNKTIIFITFLIVSLCAFYYFFIDTLTISEIAGKQKNAKATIFLNLFDFDTGLTRYDVYRLAQKSEYWDARMKQVYSIQDPNRRNIEHEKLLAEMMEDPAFKKIARKLFGLGGKASLTIMQIISNMAVF